MALADAVSSAVAHWTLDETSGTRSDSIGSNHLTDTNTVGSAAGKFSNAADFEKATDEKLSIASTSDVQTGDIDFMFRCWVQLESNTDQNRVLAKCNSAVTALEYQLFIKNAGGPRRFQFEVFNGAGTNVGAVGWGANVATGTWYLLHAWHSATDNEVGLAVDAGTAVTSSTTGAPGTNASDFSIGSLGAFTSSGYWDGLIDDVVLLKGYILDATERTADYNAGTGVAFADWSAGGGGISIPAVMHHRRLQGVS